MEKVAMSIYEAATQRFRDPKDYVVCLFTMTKDIQGLSVDDLVEAIRSAHPLSEWQWGPEIGIAAAVGQAIEDGIDELEPLRGRHFWDESREKIISACVFALLGKVTDREWTAEESWEVLKVLFVLCWLVDDSARLGEDRGKVQILVRRCGRVLCFDTVCEYHHGLLLDGHPVRQWFANLLAVGLTERTGSSKVWQAYEVSEEGIPADDKKKWVEAKQLCEQLLEKELVVHDESSERVRYRESLCSTYSQLFGSEAVIALVENVRPDLVGELTRGIEIDLQVGHIEDGEIEHK